MSFDQIIMWIMAVGVLIGGADCILNSRFGLGEKFEEGFLCLGPTALSMVGIICLSSKLAEVLGPVVIPVFKFLGADPAMFASILAIDMGGYSLACALAQEPSLGLFSGLIVSSMLGVSMVFSIPLGLKLIREEDREYFARGLMAGIIPIPAGSALGGLLMGLPFSVVAVNLIPILFIAVLLFAGLSLNPEKMVKGFLVFGKGVQILTVVGLCAAAFQYLTGVELIPDMPPVMEAMETVSGICLVLLGSLPLMTLLMRLMKKPFETVGKRMGLNSAAVGGILFSCISLLPVFRMFEEMPPRGKVVVTAFGVNAIAVFAAHLGFTVSVKPDLLVPVIAAKLSAAFLGAALALFQTRKITS